MARHGSCVDDRQHSPLAARSVVSHLEVDVPENTDEYMAMTSRIVHLVILRCFGDRVHACAEGPDFLPHLAKIKSSLKAYSISKL